MESGKRSPANFSITQQAAIKEFFFIYFKIELALVETRVMLSCRSSSVLTITGKSSRKIMTESCLSIHRVEDSNFSRWCFAFGTYFSMFLCMAWTRWADCERKEHTSPIVDNALLMALNSEALFMAKFSTWLEQCVYFAQGHDFAEGYNSLTFACTPENLPLMLLASS